MDCNYCYLPMKITLQCIGPNGKIMHRQCARKAAIDAAIPKVFLFNLIHPRELLHERNAGGISHVLTTSGYKVESSLVDKGISGYRVSNPSGKRIDVWWYDPVIAQPVLETA